MRIHTNFGNVNIFNQDIDLSASIKCGSELKLHSINVSAKFTKDNFNAKLKGIYCTHTKSLSIMDSWLFRKNKFLIGGSGVINCASSSCNGCAMLVGMEDEKLNVYARSYFGSKLFSLNNVVVTAILKNAKCCADKSKKGDETNLKNSKCCTSGCDMGVELDINKNGSINNATFGVQKTLNNGVLVKSKID